MITSRSLWKKGIVLHGSYLWDIPQGVLKFAMNAGLNTLPTFDNLKRWGKRVNDRCPFCGNIQTLLHVLSNCSVALDQGRYTWRHDSVLGSIIDIVYYILYLIPDSGSFPICLAIRRPMVVQTGTVPPHVLVTNWPDIFLINEAAKKVVGFKC